MLIYDILINYVVIGINFLICLGNPVFSQSQVPLPIQLAVALYQFGTFGNSASVGHVATKFGVSEGTVFNAMARITIALLSLKQNWIQWPSAEERKIISSRMAQYSLPKCIVDGSDAVLCSAPIDDKEVYWSRKKRYGIQFQVVCDLEKQIRHFFCGYPASVHDAKVYSACLLYKNPMLYKRRIFSWGFRLLTL